MDEVIAIKLVAKKDFTLYDMFDNEHDIKQGDELIASRANMKGLKLIFIKIDGQEMYYFESWVEKFFEIVELS